MMETVDGGGKIDKPVDKAQEAFDRMYVAKENGASPRELERMYEEERAKLSEEDRKKFETPAKWVMEKTVDHSVRSKDDDDDENGAV